MSPEPRAVPNELASGSQTPFRFRLVSQHARSWHVETFFERATVERWLLVQRAVASCRLITGFSHLGQPRRFLIQWRIDNFGVQRLHANRDGGEILPERPMIELAPVTGRMEAHELVRLSVTHVNRAARSTWRSRRPSTQ